MIRHDRLSRAAAMVLLVIAALFSWLAAPAGAEIKVLICAGDYGMWAQERMPMIRDALEKASPGLASFTNEQSCNFVSKLEAPGFVKQFDVVVFGDISLGQITPEAQQALVDFVEQGGSAIYAALAKSTIPYSGVHEVVPMPFESVLPYEPADVSKALPDTKVMKVDDPFFKGLDFSSSPADRAKPMLMKRAYGKGNVYGLFGGFGDGYKYISYAKFEPEAVLWSKWTGLGEFWTRLLKDATANSVQKKAPTGAVKPVSFKADIDATKAVDDVRAANFSIVALQQLYNEDGAAREEFFLDLNPTGLFDRRTQEVLANKNGKYPDKPAMLRQFGIKGIIMADNSYGSYGKWDDAMYTKQIDAAVEAAKKYPDILAFFQPGNEPPLDENYFKFHNRISKGVIDKAPELKVIGPNKAFNLLGVNPKEMTAFIAACGQTTDVLNWHIYAQPPEIVKREVLYWSKQADGKLRTPGPGRVMFTEADAWNTGDSQFNYLMTRALTFLPMKEIIATFQYCMEPRFEGGTYNFGVLQPDGPFSANYNGYWIWRDLRGKLVQVTPAASPQDASRNLHVIASSDKDGAKVTVIAYYDSGYFDQDAVQFAKEASFELNVQLPSGQFKAVRSDAAWNVRKSANVDGGFEKTASLKFSLAPCQAVAYTFIRQ